MRQIEEIRDQLAARAKAETDGWLGLAGAGHRRRAQELTLALDGTARTVLSAGSMAHQMGELVAGARRQVNDRITALVRELVGYAKPAVAAEGGVTPDIKARCLEMIDKATGPIDEIEENLRNAYGRGTRLFMKRGGGGGRRPAMRGVTEAQMIKNILNAPRTRSARCSRRAAGHPTSTSASRCTGGSVVRQR